MKRVLFALALALLQPRTAHADSDWSSRDRDRLGWYVPDFARVQTGGYTGLFNVGVGYAAFNDVLNWSIGYGYTPPFTADRHVHSIDTTLSIRPLDVRVRRLRVVPFYVGGGLLFGFGEGYFLRVPARYREYSSRYYPPTAVHWIAHVGAELDWLPNSTFFERHGGFVEIRTLDTYFFSYVENPSTLGLGDALSLAFGYRAAF